MGTISSGSFTTRAGDGSIDIDPDNNTALPATTMKVSDVGKLSIEYDLEEDTKDVRNILFSPSKFKFKAFDRLGNGDSLFEELDNIASTTLIEVDFSFTTDGGTSWTDRIFFTTNNIEYDRIKREVSIEARYINEGSNLTITDIFDAYAESNFYDGTSTHRTQAAKSFIENVFDANTTGTNTVINNSNNFSDSPFVDANDTWVILNDNDGNVYEQEQNANTVLYRLAAADGSIVGKMMGFSFFTYRLDTTENATISESDATSLTINPSLSNYRNVTVLLTSRIGTNNFDSWASIGALYQESDGINPDAPKSLLANYVMQELQPASWDQANNRFIDDGFTITTSTGANIDVEPKDGDLVFSVDADPSLLDGEFMTVRNDITGINIVQSSDANRIVAYDPWKGYLGSGTLSVQQYINTSERPALAEGAADSYAKAYGADGSRLISIDLLDVDTLMPYETFTLDSSFPQLVQNQTFRPSDITYDLELDKIEVEAYQIA